VQRANHAGLGGLNWIPLVVDRRRRASQVVNLVYFNVKRKRYIVSDEFEVRVTKEVAQVAPGTRAKVVDCKNLVPKIKEAAAEVGAYEAGPSGDQHPPRGALMPGKRCS
jgi:hypothetical protein